MRSFCNSAWKQRWGICPDPASRGNYRGELRPHQIRYYVEKRDPDFELKMTNVLHVYKEVEIVNEYHRGAAGQQPRMVTISYHGGRFGSEDAVVADVLFREGVAIVATDHWIGQVEIFDYGLQLARVLLGRFAAEDQGDLLRLADGSVLVNLHRV